MRSLPLHFVNPLIGILPSTRLFGLKRLLWRVCGVEVGQAVSINIAAAVQGGGGLSVGQGTWIGARCNFVVPAGASARIGAGCDLAPEVLVVCGSHEIGPPARRAGPGTARSVLVGDGCWIGARVVILGGAEIGTGCVIAAGAVVLPGSYAANSLLAGVPAKPVRVLGGLGS